MSVFSTDLVISYFEVGMKMRRGVLDLSFLELSPDTKKCHGPLRKKKKSWMDERVTLFRHFKNDSKMILNVGTPLTFPISNNDVAMNEVNWGGWIWALARERCHTTRDSKATKNWKDNAKEKCDYCRPFSSHVVVKKNIWYIYTIILCRSGLVSVMFPSTI